MLTVIARVVFFTVIETVSTADELAFAVESVAVTVKVSSFFT